MVEYSSFAAWELLDMDNVEPNVDVVGVSGTMTDNGYMLSIVSESPDHEPVSMFLLSDEQAAALACMLITRG